MTTDERLDRIDATLSGLGHAIQGINSYLLEFRTEMIQRFDQLETRLEMVEATVHSVDARLPALTKAINNLQVRMDKLEKPAA
jgi:uncharacterized coiled-coil protein SlyX